MSTSDRNLTPFVALEGATALSGAANGVSMVAFPWLVLELTGSASYAAAIGAITLVPLLVTSLLSGTLVDILGRRRVSVASDVLSLLSVAAIPILSGLVGLSFALLAVLAVIGAFFDPAGTPRASRCCPRPPVPRFCHSSARTGCTRRSGASPISSALASVAC